MSAKITQSRQDAEKIPIIQRAGCGPLPESLCPSISPSLHRAFTLIELMVVIGIIGLLIAIVVPAISNARDHAKEVVTLGTIRALETGLETYRADTRLDGDYPPSVFTTLAKSPYVTANDTTQIPVCGANLLVWGLAGADLLGTPGFRNLDRSNSSSTANDIYHDPFGEWCSDTGAGTFSSGTKPRLYTVVNGQPAISRSGPFVDVSNTRMSKFVTGQGYFEIPAAKNVVLTPNANLGVLSSYCFLDSFDQPILYYKANPIAPYMVDAGSALVSGGSYDLYRVANDTYNPSGIYNLRDNAPITGMISSSSTVFQGMDFGAGRIPRTDSAIQYHGIAALGASMSGSNFQIDNLRGSFASTLRNQNVLTTFRPHNSDSFILLSAGKDGIFGSADDIGNFPINKD